MSTITLKEIMYQMIESTVAGEDFDRKSAYFAEYKPDGSVARYNMESVDMHPDTEMEKVGKYDALAMIQKYKDDAALEHAMYTYDSFATMDTDEGKVVYAWNNRN